MDDILFDFVSSSDDFTKGSCTVKAKSRSQTLSYYDYNTNYCNMWNVLAQVPAKYPQVADQSVAPADWLTQALVTEDCKWAPEDPKKTCAVY